MCDCDRALELLSARLDGALDDAERVELEEHLSSCEACRAAADELAAIHGIMPELLEEVPQGFHGRLMEKIAAEKVISFPVKKRHTAWKSWASLAAVFAVVLLGGNGLNQLSTGKPSAPAPMSVAPAGEGYALDGIVDGAAVPQSTPSAVTYGGSEIAPEAYAGDQIETGNGAAKSVAPAAMDVGAPTPVPTAPADPANSAPQLQVRLMSNLTPEQAGTVAAETEYPGVVVVDIADADGNYSGFRVTPASGESLEVSYLGLSVNGAYHEFLRVDPASGEELDRFAVKADGTAVETLTKLGQDAYNALVCAE